jgi:hypothetical protein
LEGEREVKVLSLFDGGSTGLYCFNQLGINPRYYASEIDKNAIKVSEDNHKGVVRLGDVTKLSYKNGFLVSEFERRYVGKIDFLIGGSPCQSFSQAAAISGNETGLDGKSKLFYEYLRLMNEIRSENPDLYFLLENVKMKNESKAQLDNYLGVNGKYLNSELVSFQKRPRFYWANWDWDLPDDMNISFQDFKESGDLSKYKVNRTPSREKMWKNGNGKGGIDACANITNSKKVYCLTLKQDRSPNSGLIEYEDFCRYLTRSELEQAQTLPIGYTKSVSYNQAQAVLGNGWTANAIIHILRQNPLIKTKIK